MGRRSRGVDGCGRRRGGGRALLDPSRIPLADPRRAGGPGQRPRTEGVKRPSGCARRRARGACRNGFPVRPRGGGLAAQAGLRCGECRAYGRSGHRWPRRAKRQGRVARRRQDGRRGDGRRLGRVRHHSAGIGAWRSQPFVGRGSGRLGAGNVESGRRLGSAAGSQSSGCRDHRAGEGGCARARLARPGDADPGDAACHGLPKSRSSRSKPTPTAA